DIAVTNSPIFSYHQAKQLAVPFVASKVSLPDSPPSASLLDLLPPNEAAWLSAPSAAILNLKAKPARIPRSPSTDQEYISLVRRMHSLGMLSFTSDPACVNKVFTILKDQDSLRLIINAQSANLQFLEPPHVNLPSPDVLAALVLDPFARLFIAKVDISNFYHNLTLPAWLHRYFALPAIRPQDIGLPGSDDSVIFPCCSTVPMGWSWSVFLAQTAHEHLLYSSGIFNPADALSRFSDSFLNRPRHSLYIDDLSIFSTDPNICRDLQTRYIAQCQSVGLPVKLSKVVLPCLRTEVIGVEIDGHKHTVGIAPEKLAALINRTQQLLHHGVASGEQIEQLIGAGR